MDIQERAKKIKLLVVDVDGVLTDGRIIYDNYGDELKFFDVHDGFGLTLLYRAGIKLAIVTANRSKAVRHRAKDHKAAAVFQNSFDKLKAYDKLLHRFKVHSDEICYVGDDLIDIPILSRVGLAVCVGNGNDDVKKIAHYVTHKKGGRGAVREVVELLLKSQGRWDEVVRKYFS